MSRSILKSKFLKRGWEHRITRNPNRIDEMPQNHPSKFISCRCPSIKVDWVQGHCPTWGHHPDKHGRTRINGIVRQKAKEEIRREILEYLQQEIGVIQ